MASQAAAKKRAPRKKAASKKEAPPKEQAQAGTTAPKVAVVKYESVPCDTLVPYADNPRQGDVAVIVESLQEHGQFKPIVVNIGTKTGEPNSILAGNHTWIAAYRELGWSHIDVAWVDADAKEAAKIVLIDNRANDLATYKSDQLAKVIDFVKDAPKGTGYTSEDMTAILEARNAGEADAIAEVVRPEVELVTGGDNPIDMLVGDDEDVEAEFADGDVEEGGPSAEAPFEPEKDEDDEVQFDDAQGKLQGILALNEDMDLQGKNWYGIPELRPDRILQAFPDKVDTWAGKDVTPDDGDTWWLWNYGLAPWSGIPPERTILTFFTYDTKFDGWWPEPAYYTAKTINNGVKVAIVPDYSFYSDWPRAHHIQSAYNGQWMGRFFQEAGMQVIPRLQFDDIESFKFNLLGIPKGTPTLACSVQNVERHQDKDEQGFSKNMHHNADMITHGLAELKPKEVLFYGGGTARKIIENLITVPKGTKVRMVDNYVAKRRGVAFDKKEGLGSSGKQNKVKKALKKQSTKEEDEDDGE